MESFWWFRIKGTVILHIWWQVILMMGYTAVIVAINNHTPISLNFGPTLIPVMGAVVSLLMGFRTNSAYSRYWDGRTIWSQMTKNVRSLVLSIWINVNGTETKDIIEKKSAINLCMAFVIATKHYLREEYSYNTDDMKDLIFHLKKYSAASTSNLAETKPTETKLRSSGSEPNLPTSPEQAEQKSELIIKMPFGSERRRQRLRSTPPPQTAKPFKLMAYDYPTPTNIPLEILCYLLSYVNHVALNKTGESFCINTMNGTIGSLLENLTNFERILRTPIPLAYSIHLHHCVWIYLLAVPFQFVQTHSWGTMLIVGLGSFCMLGILSIAYEIENPFGYDDNDLPLDDFCAVLKREIEMITGVKPPVSEEWVKSPNNRPFKYADCNLNAEELFERTPTDLHDMLAQNAKLSYWVDNLVRKRQ